MNDVLKFLTDNSVLVVVGIVTGILIRYVPILGKIPNWVTPWLNGLVVFFGAWAPAAHAGIFGNIAGEVSGLAKLVASAAIVALQSGIYEALFHHPFRLLEAKGALKKQ